MRKLVFKSVFALLVTILIFIPMKSAEAGQYRSMVIRALEQDSEFWAFNRLVRGSYGPEIEQSGYKNGHHVYRMNYAYNGSSQGWVEVYIVNGVVKSIRYHDNNDWAFVRTQASEALANSSNTQSGDERDENRSLAKNIKPYGYCIGIRKKMIKKEVWVPSGGTVSSSGSDYQTRWMQVEYIYNKCSFKVEISYNSSWTSGGRVLDPGDESDLEPQSVVSVRRAH